MQTKNYDITSCIWKITNLTKLNTDEKQSPDLTPLDFSFWQISNNLYIKPQWLRCSCTFSFVRTIILDCVQLVCGFTFLKMHCCHFGSYFPIYVDTTVPICIKVYFSFTYFFLKTIYLDLWTTFMYSGGGFLFCTVLWNWMPVAQNIAVNNFWIGVVSESKDRNMIFAEQQMQWSWQTGIIGEIFEFVIAFDGSISITSNQIWFLLFSIDKCVYVSTHTDENRKLLFSNIYTEFDLVYFSGLTSAHKDILSGILCATGAIFELKLDKYIGKQM